MKKIFGSLIILLITNSSLAGIVRVWDDSATSYPMVKPSFLQKNDLAHYISIKLEGSLLSVQDCEVRREEIFNLRSLNSKMESSNCHLKYQDQKFDANSFREKALINSGMNLGTKKLRALFYGTGALLTGLETVGVGLFTVLSAVSPGSQVFAPLLGAGTVASAMEARSFYKLAREDYSSERIVSRPDISYVIDNLNINPDARHSFSVDNFRLFSESFFMLLDKIQ